MCVFRIPKVWQIYILDSFSWNFLSSTIPEIVRSNQLNRKSIYICRMIFFVLFIAYFPIQKDVGNDDVLFNQYHQEKKFY